MFKRKTVFIVGAGASKEFGLPVGAELSAQIMKLCSPDIDDWGRIRSRDMQTILNSFDPEASTDNVKAQPWLEAMREIRLALPYKDSIDAVIDQYYDRPEIAVVGKYMIAKLIMEAEEKSSLRAINESFQSPNLTNCQGTWLHTFARMLFEGIRKDALSELGKNVTIICFNYDRCIERYLSFALAEAYNLEVTEAMQIASQVPIIHSYGSLGRLPGWPSENTNALEVPFGGGRRPMDVARNIQTFSESVDGETDNLIKDVMLRAEQYVYLGLSFGRQNMQLLGAESRQGRAYEKPAYASGLGQHEQGRAAINRLIKSTYSASGVAPTLRRADPATHLELGATAKQLLDLHWHNILG